MLQQWRESLLSGPGAALAFVIVTASVLLAFYTAGRSATDDRYAKHALFFSVVGLLLSVFLAACSENVPQREAREKLEQRVKELERAEWKR